MQQNKHGGLTMPEFSNIRFKCSEDQRYIAENTIFYGDEFFILPSERILVYETVKTMRPKLKILSANFDFENMMWEIQLEGGGNGEKETKSIQDDIRDGG